MLYTSTTNEFEDICHSGSSRGIWTRIPCEARITIIFYWSVPIKQALEKPLTNCDALPDDKFRLCHLFTNREINIGTNMGEKPYQTIFLAFSYCNLFFKVSKNLKRWWDDILQNKSCPSPALPQGYGLIFPDWLTNQITGLAKIFDSSKIYAFIVSLVLATILCILH